MWEGFLFFFEEKKNPKLFFSPRVFWEINFTNLVSLCFYSLKHF